MLNNLNNTKHKFSYTGQQGLPENYPIPDAEDTLFYIQRNHNCNTIVYTLNPDDAGLPHHDKPIDVYWLKYDEGKVRKELNIIQFNLAYGYRSWRINNEVYQFQFLAYSDQNFFLSKDDEGMYRVYTKLDDKMIILSNIYVYAEEFGAFPQVKYLEFFGYTVEETFPFYKKLLF